MSFNLLIEQLPYKIQIDDKDYKIDSSFKTIILIDSILREELLDDTEKIVLCLSYFYKNSIPDNKQEAFEKLLLFRNGVLSIEELEENREYDILGNPIEQKSGERAYDFEIDSKRIFSAFYQQYRIDLQEVEQLHWFKFLALFEGLTEETELVKIMQFRTIDISSNMSKEQKQFYTRMKNKYRLPSSNVEAKNDFADQFLIGAIKKGGDS